MNNLYLGVIFSRRLHFFSLQLLYKMATSHLCANCSDLDIHALIEGKCKAAPRKGSKAELWEWKPSSPACDWCMFMVKARYQMDEELSEDEWRRRLQRDDPTRPNKVAAAIVTSKLGTWRVEPDQILGRFGCWERKDMSIPSGIDEMGFGCAWTVEPNSGPKGVYRIPRLIDFTILKKFMELADQRDIHKDWVLDTFDRPIQVIDCRSRVVKRAPSRLSVLCTKLCLGKVNGKLHRSR
jgi:hypothetical protein